jgi:hypothetical protein
VFNINLYFILTYQEIDAILPIIDNQLNIDPEMLVNSAKHLEKKIKKIPV